MSRDDALLNSLFTLTRGDLENATLPFPQFRSHRNPFHFFKITRISSFWEHGNGAARVPFEQHMEDFVTGLYGQRLSWAFLIEAESQALKVGFGAKNQGHLNSLRASILATMPDVRLSGTTFARDGDLAQFNHAAQIVGCPTGKVLTGQGLIGDQVERLCRGLFGEPWAYLVVASPIEPAETTGRMNDVAREIRTVHETLMVKGSGAEEHNRLARQYVELLEAKLKRLQQGRTAGMWQVGAYLLASSSDVLSQGAALLSAAFSGEKSLPDPLRVRPCQKGIAPANPPEPLSSRELSVLAAIPREEFPGYEVTEHVRFSAEVGHKPKGRTLSVGEIVDRGRPIGTSFEISINDLTKHSLIAGVTGSGKTNTCFGLLERIWNEGRGTPFLIIEPAKSEYRSLLTDPRFRGLRVFTLGNETVSPFRMNPFEVPPGVQVQTHIDYLKALFAAAFVLYPPMPYVLEQSIQEIYQDRGWNLAANANRRGITSKRIFPTLSDLYLKVSDVIQRMGYNDEITMNVRSGLQARIDQLRIGGGKGLMLDTRNSVSMEDIFESPCVLELKQIVSDDEKAFLIGLILIRLYERYESGHLEPKEGLRHLTLIEEAHRLLRNVSTEQGSEVSANPRGHAIEVFANILSEIRAYGEGILIAEQVPVKLTPDAIKNTNLKIVHRLLAEDDRRAVGGTIGLTEPQSRYLPTLTCGEAVAFAEGMRKPVLLSIALSQAKASVKAVSDREVKAAMADFWQQQQNLLMRFPGCSPCFTARRAMSCSHHEGIYQDWNSRRALRHFLGAMIHNRSAVVPAFVDLALVLRQYAHSNQTLSTYCVIVQFLEKDFEQKSAFYGWPYTETDKIISKACAIAWTLSERIESLDHADLNNLVQNDVEDLARFMNPLCKQEKGPFPACVPCQAKCQFRYEIKTLEQEVPSHAIDFRAAYADSTIQLDELPRFCWEASADCFPENDNVTRRQAAFCFAAQQLARMGLPTYAQQKVGVQLNEQIQEKGDLDYGQDRI